MPTRVRSTMTKRGPRKAHTRATKGKAKKPKRPSNQLTKAQLARVRKMKGIKPTRMQKSESMKALTSRLYKRWGLS